MSNRTTVRRFVHVGWNIPYPIIIVLMGIALLLVVLIVRNSLFLQMAPPCPFFALTKFSCPGCGTLRALHQVALGNIIPAFRCNPLAMITLPFILFSFFRYIQNTMGNRSHQPVFVPSFYIWIFLGIVVSFGVLRNIV